MNDSPGQTRVLKNGRQDMNSFLGLVGALSAAALPIALLFLGGDLVTNKNAMRAYILSVAAVFAVFLALAAAGEGIRKRAPKIIWSLESAYVTLVVPAACLLIALTVLHILSPAGYVWAILSVHLIFLPLWWFGRKRISASAFFAKANQRVIQWIPLCYAGIFWTWFSVQYQPHLGLRSAAVLIAAIAAFTLFAKSDRLRNIRLRLRSHWWMYLLFGSLLIGLVYQPELPFDRYHSNPFLATMLDVRSGKVLFVDALSTYGVGLIYFIRAVFQFLRLPLSYPGLAAVLNVLYILQFAGLFLILHKATKSLLLSLAGLGAILYFAFFAVAWPSMLLVPAHSPLRYGMTYLLLGAGWIGMNRTGKLWRVLELALLGAASVWSLETFLYSILSLNALHFVGDVLFSRQRKTGLRTFFKRIVMQMGVVLICWGAWWTATYLSSGQFPNLAYYFDIFDFFMSVHPYGYPMDFRSLWTGVSAALYLGSILAVLFAGWKRRDRLPVETAALLAALSVAGLLQYLYFFIYGIDIHFSLVCTPLIMVITLWIFITQNELTAGGIPRLNRWIFGMAVVVSLWFCTFQTSTWFSTGIKNSYLYKILTDPPSGENITFRDPYRFPASNDTVSALVALTWKYAADERSIVVFALPDDQVEALLLTGKTHLLDMTDPAMCSFSRSFSAHMLELARMYAGIPEYIFYDSSYGALLDIQRDAFRILTSAGRYSVVEMMGPILVYHRE